MIHGESDTSVPLEGQRIFYQGVTDIYKEHQENLKLVEVPNMNHYISTGMFELGIDWFKKYLLSIS